MRGLAPRPSLPTVPHGGPTWSTDMQQLPLSQTAWGWRNSMHPGTPPPRPGPISRRYPGPRPLSDLNPGYGCPDLVISSPRPF